MAVGNPISLTDNVASRIVSQTATASQTDFTISGGYRLNAISVYRNGVRLVSGRDYSAADGSTVVLLSPATVSDSLQFHIFDDFRVADAIVSNASHQNIEGNVTLTGILSATNAQLQSLTVTNDVSIGGTLTYQDVTNIDSVGIITARTDVHVGAGLSVVGVSTFNGNAIFNGNVDLGNASGDTITATGRFDSDLIPSVDDQKDLGSSALEWRNLYLDGTANIDTLSISGISTFTGDVFIADKIVHTGDNNTAIRFPDTDTFSVETSGLERLRITSTGSVGIGTASPIFKLQVDHADEDGILIKTANTAASFINFSDGDDNDVGQISYDHATNHLAFRVNATERLRIDSAGRLGIGGNGVGSGLGVYLQRPSPNTTHFYEASDGTKTMITGVDSTNDYVKIGTLSNHRLGLVANNGEKVSILPGGNIGIGVTNPEDYDSEADDLVISSGGADTGITLVCGTSVGSHGSIFFADGTGSAGAKKKGQIRYEQNNEVMSFHTNEQQRLTIDLNGKIGIGTDNPDYGLHVYGAGDILVEDSNNGSAHLRLRSSNGGTDVSNWKIKTASNNFLYIENDTAGGSQFTIDNTGKFGINDATPSVSLDLASNTDALSLPTGTTAQRPSGTDAYIRKNSTNNALEFYNGTEWVEIITDYFPTGSTTLG